MIYILSICYYTYDLYPTHQQYSAPKINFNQDKKSQDFKNSVYYFGFMVHHILTLFGLISGLYYNICGRIILLCFILGEFSNIPRLIHKIIMRRMETMQNHSNNNNNSGNGNNNSNSNGNNAFISDLLYKVYIIFKASFVWCRMLSTQLLIKVIQPLAPIEMTVCAYLLLLFTVATVLVEWKFSQNAVWDPRNRIGNTTGATQEAHLNSHGLKRKYSPNVSNSTTGGTGKHGKKPKKTLPKRNNVYRR